MKRLALFLLIFSVVIKPTFAAHFQDSNGLIIIRSDTADFRVVSAKFPAYEATYEAPPDGAIRIWTDNYQCLQHNGTQTGDPFFSQARFDAYVGNIAAYQAAYDAAHLVPTPTPQPAIYADVQISADRVKVTGDTITFQAWLKDAGGTVLPVTASWIIRLRDADGEEVDAFEVQFTNGSTPEMAYTCPPNANLGRIHVDDNDFAPVEVPGVGTFQVKLLTPVEITIYRTL